jgi:hypothetical protein
LRVSEFLFSRAFILFCPILCKTGLAAEKHPEYDLG